MIPIWLAILIIVVFGCGVLAGIYVARSDSEGNLPRDRNDRR